MYATWFIDEYGDYGGRIAGAVLSEPGAFTSDGLEDYMDRMFPPWGYTSEELNDVVWSDQFMSPSDHARADFMQATRRSRTCRRSTTTRQPSPFWRPGAVVSASSRSRDGPGFDWTTHLGEFPHQVLFLRGDLNENSRSSTSRSSPRTTPRAR